MINVWPYEYCGMVELIDIDGSVWVGKALDATDSGDRSDLEKEEDGITLNVEGRLIEFYASEIKSIKKIK